MSSHGDHALFDVNGDYDEAAALEAAIALSLEKAPSQSPPLVSASLPQGSSFRLQPPIPQSPFGSLVLDRKKMEAERLARQRKRSASVAGLEPSPTRGQPAPASPMVSTALGQSAASINTSHGGNLRFPKGTVRRTWALGYSRTGQDIKIEEIFERSQLELAVLSSFQWDEAWIFSKIDISRTKVVLIAFASDEAQQQEMRGNVPGDRIRFCFPKMSGSGCMHSKLQLLKFKSHLRIVVPSGNLVPYDWGETGELENTVFLIDLPLLESAGSTMEPNAPPVTPFGVALRHFLRAQGLDESLVRSLDKYDFTETERYGFIHTISGSHTDGASQKTGYCGLGSTVKRLGLDNVKPISIHYITSSLGSIDGSFLTALYYACQGDSGMKEYQARQSRSGKSKGITDGAGTTSHVSLADCFRIYFPSETTVVKSKGGKSAAGTICFKERWWKSPSFPRETLRDAVNTRQGVLVHSKLIFVCAKSRDAPGPAWAYVGSANMSESAWGRMVKDRGTGHAKLTCRNWECGVLVPVDVDTPEQSSKPGTMGEDGLKIFEGKVPLPIAVPGQVFGSSSNQSTEQCRQPWFFEGRGGI